MQKVIKIRQLLSSMDYVIIELLYNELNKDKPIKKHVYKLHKEEYDLDTLEASDLTIEEAMSIIKSLTEHESVIEINNDLISALIQKYLFNDDYLSELHTEF